MDNFLCVSWNNTNFKWTDLNITWREACIINNIINDKYICFKWSNYDKSWMNADITWKEACVISKVIKTRGRGKLRRNVWAELDKEEKETVIKLIVRIKENGYLYSTDEKKVKKEEIDVTMRDIKLFIRELKQIKVTAKL